MYDDESQQILLLSSCLGPMGFPHGLSLSSCCWRCGIPFIKSKSLNTFPRTALFGCSWLAYVTRTNVLHTLVFFLFDKRRRNFLDSMKEREEVDIIWFWLEFNIMGGIHHACIYKLDWKTLVRHVVNNISLLSISQQLVIILQNENFGLLFHVVGRESHRISTSGKILISFLISLLL